MKYTVQKDNRSVRFVSSNKVLGGSVKIDRVASPKRGVSDETFKRAKESANSSLASIENK